MQYDVLLAPEKVATLLAGDEEAVVSVATPQRSWQVRMAAGGLRVDEPGAAAASGTIEGRAPDVLLWLWNRGGDNVTTSGDAAAVALLRNVVDAVLGHRVED